VQYPHATYITYLLSRKMNAMEIRADCATKDLQPPGDLELRELATRLGEIPTFWKSTVTSTNIKFRRWLRDKGILRLWVRDEVTDQAFSMLYKAEMRRDFETVILAHGDIGRAHGELLIKYPEGMVPNEAVLDRYQEFFWNVGAMHPEQIYNYLKVVQDREEYLPALQGDMARTYGTLGLQQRIRGEVFLQHCVEFACEQVLRGRANPNLGAGTLAGISSVMKSGMDALDRLEERHIEVEGDSSVRRDAADFVARVVQASAVPSLDDLMGLDVIDVEPEAVVVGGGNVLKLSGPRRAD
jgi:hypothetical protein